MGKRRAQGSDWPFNEIGKEIRDLLCKDYQSGYSLSVAANLTNGSTYTYSLARVGDSFMNGLMMQMKEFNFTTDFKVDHGSKLLSSFTFHEPSLGMKTRLSFNGRRPNYGKVELHWRHEFAAVSTISYINNPMIDLSCVVGNRAFSFGADLSYNSKSQTFTRNDREKTLNGSICHVVSALTVVGAEIAHKISVDKSITTIGVKHALDPSTLVKARLNNHGKASAVVQHECLPKSFVTISGEVDLMAMKKVPKFGFSLAMNLDQDEIVNGYL